MLGKDRVFPFLADLASENRCCADFGSGVGMGQNDLSTGMAGHRRGPAISTLVGSVGVGQVVHMVRVRDTSRGRSTMRR